MTRSIPIALLLAAVVAGCEQQRTQPIHGNEIELSEANFDDVVRGSDKPVLVDFWAPWCGPCRDIAPTVAELSVQYDGQLVVGKVNVDDHPQLARQYNVSGIPHLVILDKGRVVDSVTGSDETSLRRKVAAAVADSGAAQ